MTETVVLPALSDDEQDTFELLLALGGLITEREWRTESGLRSTRTFNARRDALVQKGYVEKVDMYGRQVFQVSDAWIAFGKRPSWAVEGREDDVQKCAAARRIANALYARMALR